ncbi:kelch-like protein 17 [Ceratitis capitata]|uniref:kelch-like protein 17 n=1 Tax=Ceratitis capitata TaxID=7213 RepID=UPI0006188D80|nr:kelch-like protein 17 [Ceratitis capitata]
MATCIASSRPVRDGSTFTEKLLIGLRQFYDEQKLVDVTFKVSTVLIPAHRLILSAASAYFENLLSNNQGVTPFIEINNIASDTFERLITHCYTGQTLITLDNVNEMLNAAIIFQLDDAVADCLDYIFDNIREYTLERLYSIERDTQCEILRRKILEYEEEHFMELNGSAEFLKFGSEKLKGILESEVLNVSCEKDIFAALKSWYEHDTKGRECHLPDLVGCLRLLQFDASFIMANIQPLPGCELLAFHALLWISQPLTRTKITFKFTAPRESIRRNLEDTAYLALETYRTDNNKCILQYNQIEDKWLKYADINYPNEVKVIPNGENLIFIGGKSNEERTAEVKSWNLRTKTWTQLPRMNCPRIAHSVVLLDDIIYVIGGWNISSAMNTVDVFSFTGEWHSVKAMNVSRALAAAVTLNGNIFVMGGQNATNVLNSVERYDPTSNVWTLCANMNNEYTSHGAAVHKGFIFVVGTKSA